MEIIEIKNRHGLKMQLRLIRGTDKSKLVFLEHALASRKEYPHMLVLEQVFLEHGYTVVNFDATNSLNQSESSNEGITLTGHYHDLEDVINWAKTQDFFTQHFALAGQSIGALSVVRYAGTYPSSVNLLFPIAVPYLNGKQQIEESEMVKEIILNGFYNKYSKSTGRTLVLKTAYYDDLKTFDLEPFIKNITAPTHVIIGPRDTQKHLYSSKQMFDMLNCEKYYYTLDGIPHDLANTPRDKNLFYNTLTDILNNLKL